MRVIYILLSLSVFISCNSLINKKENNNYQVEIYDNLKNNTFSSTIKNVLKFYNEKNETELNKLIHPKTGVYYLFRIGAPNIWTNKNHICLSENCKDDNKSFGLQYWHKDMIKKQILEMHYPIKYESYPEFCYGDNQETTKEGVFIDTLKINRILSKTIRESEELFEKKKIESEVSKTFLLENDSRRIVVASNNNNFYGSNFIFHLTYIEGRWYLTLIDLITTDCSV